MRKLTNDTFDLDLVPFESVLVGTRRVELHDIERKPYELELLKKLSEEVSFIPTILDYQILSRESYQYAIADLGEVTPLDFFAMDLAAQGSFESVGVALKIRRLLMYKWRNQIEEFAERQGAVVKLYSFWDGCVVNKDNSIIFLNFDQIQFFPLEGTEEDAKHMKKTHFDRTDQERLSFFIDKLNSEIFAKKEAERIKEKFDHDLTYLKEKHDQMMKQKNEKIKNSISKDVIKAQLGEDLYYMYFGEEDDS